jgi:hypothetical protein
MQLASDIVLYSNILIGIITFSMGAYLLHLWYKQETRLVSDLPLVFGISFTTQSMNNTIVSLANLGIIEMTMSVFRVRSLLIGGSVVPILGAILNIWAPRYSKYHTRLVTLFAAFWVITGLILPTQELIMILHIPLMLVFGLMLVATFFITWKTGRLKEVRSGMMVVGTFLGIIGQGARVPLLNSPFFFVPDILLLVSMVVVLVALTNPWYHRKKGVEIRTEPEPVPLTTY